MKTLVIYYSAQNHTKTIAEKIAKNLGADTYEITPETPYSEADLDWMDPNARCLKEHDDESLRDIALKDTDIANWGDYERVLICYPVWWGIAAWAVNSFIKTKKFENKTVIPVAVSHSSPLADSGKLLEKDADGGDWQEGIRFFQDAPEDEIKAWTDTL